MLSNNPDPVYKKIWNDKIDLRFKTSDLSESVFGVYKGKNIVIDWRGAILQFLPKYSTPNGDPLIHVSNSPYMRVYTMGIFSFKVVPMYY